MPVHSRTGILHCMSVMALQASIGESQKQIYTVKKFSDLSDYATKGHEFHPPKHLGREYRVF